MILILAYGNSLRRDDGAGFVLADSLESILLQAGGEVKRIDSHQLAPELALDIAGDCVSAVIFIDTRAVSDPNDDLSIHVIPVVPAEIASPSLGHHFDAPVLLTYTKYLFNKEPLAWLITIPGVDFDHGEGLSETAAKALEQAPRKLQELISSVLDRPVLG
ncbi:MAG: hydrogenase maturation protease [Syntrophobacteraceae bacterium]